MAPLLSVVLALASTVLVAVLVPVLVAVLLLVLLTALLVLDVLLERNGVDRRTAARGLWARVRSADVPDRSKGAAPAASRTDAPTREGATRTPFSERLRRPAGGSTAVRPPRTELDEPAAPTPVETDGPDAGQAPAAAPSSPAASLPTTEEPAEAPTAVLPVPDAQPAAPRSRAARPTRTARVQPRRTAPRAVAEPAASEPAEEPVTAPLDRDSAMDRLFAPLLDSDSTEPLPAKSPRTRKRPE